MLPTSAGEVEKCSTSLQNTPGKKLSEASRLHKFIWKQHLPPFHPFRLVASLPITISIQLLADRKGWNGGRCCFQMNLCNRLASESFFPGVFCKLVLHFSASPVLVGSMLSILSLCLSVYS